MIDDTEEPTALGVYDLKVQLRIAQNDLDEAKCNLSFFEGKLKAMLTEIREIKQRQIDCSVENRGGEKPNSKTESGGDWENEKPKVIAPHVVKNKASALAPRRRNQKPRSSNRESIKTKAQENPEDDDDDWGISDLKVFAPEVAVKKTTEVAFKKAPEVALKKASLDQNHDSNVLRIFVGHLSSKTNAKSIKNYFGKFGEIVDAVVPKNRDTGENRGFAYVTFSHIFGVSPFDVDADDHVIDGKRVKLDHTLCQQTNVKTDSLLVSGQLMKVSNETLKAHFGKFGKILDIRRQQIQGKFTRSTFIKYSDVNSVKLAMKNPISKIDGVFVDVRPARDQAPLSTIQNKHL